MTRAERRRQEKVKNKKPVHYQCTPQQLQTMQQMAVENYKARMNDHVKKLVEDEWKERETAVTGKTQEESMLKVFCLLMAVPTKVLCEQFGWTPVREKSGKNCRLKRFAEAVINEIENVCSDENVDIRVYAEEVYEKYGVGYKVEEERFKDSPQEH